MKLTINTVSFLVLLALLSACQGNEKAAVQETPEVTEVQEPENTFQEVQDEAIRPIEEGETKEYGRVLTVEDGVYPMFWLQLEFPESGEVLDFEVNVQDLGWEAEEIHSMNGRFVTLYHKEDVSNDVVSVWLDGKNILDDELEAAEGETLEATGILEGAEQVTESDLPSTISVVNATGEKVDFSLYVGPKLIEGNGKEVVVKYQERTRQVISYIRADAEV